MRNIIKNNLTQMFVELLVESKKNSNSIQIKQKDSPSQHIPVLVMVMRS